MSQKRKIINKEAPAIDVSLNTKTIWPINKAANGDDFGKYLHELSGFFATQEAFTWINLVTAGTDVVDVQLDQVTGNVEELTKVFPMRVGQILPCRAVRILNGTDTSAQFTVGVGS